MEEEEYYHDKSNEKLTLFLSLFYNSICKYKRIQKVGLLPQNVMKIASNWQYTQRILANV